MTEDSDNNITKFPPPQTPPAKLEDEWIFRAVCNWKIARAKQQIAWAEHEQATLLGHRSDKGISLDLGPLDEMQTIEFHLSRFVPDTVLTARALLGMAVEIMAYESVDPEHHFANGPVLDIVRNCLRALEHLDGLQALRKRVE
jgi:hypothetical protein